MDRGTDGDGDGQSAGRSALSETGGGGARSRFVSVGLRGARARQSAEAARARARADRDDAAKWRRIVAGGIHLTITRVAPHAERRARPRGRAAAAARGEQAAGTSRFRARTWRREGCGYDLPSPRAWVFPSLHGWRSFGLRGVLIGRGAIWTREGFFAELKPRNRDVKAERVSLTGDPAEPATKPTSLIGPIKLAISGFVSVARFFIFS